VVITAVAAMGERGRTRGWDRLIVPAPGACWILTSISHASMMQRTNRARSVGGGVSLSSVSGFPGVSTLGGAAC